MGTIKFFFFSMFIVVVSLALYPLQVGITLIDSILGEDKFEWPTLIFLEKPE